MMKINWTDFKDPMVTTGVSLMREIHAKGYDAYIVGGAVRDLAMGDQSMHDIDIATNMPIEEIKSAYHTIEYGGGEAHGTVIVHLNDFDYELTQFRTEGTYSDGRHPDAVQFVSSFEEDTKRRDFTINAMGVGHDGQVIDFHCGLLDIQSKLLNTVGDPIDRFTEDVLRILRAVRFTARFGFDMSQQVNDAIVQLKETVMNTSMERIRDELLKISEYGSDKLLHAIQLMDSTGLLKVVLPEITYSGQMRYHLQGINSTCEIENLSILFYGMEKDEIVSVGKRLKLDNATIKGIVYVLGNLVNYGNICSVDRQIALKMVNHVNFDELRNVYIASRNSYDNCAHDVYYADTEIAAIREFNQITAFETKMSGVLKKHMTPGKDFGRVLQVIRDWVFTKFNADAKLVAVDELERYVEDNIDLWRENV